MCCRPAVERAFIALTSDGVPERHAVETAVIIYRGDVPIDVADLSWALLP
jgi:hypothetical protein